MMPFFEKTSKQHLVERALFGEGYFTKIQAEVYAQLSRLPLPDTVYHIPVELKELIDLVYTGAGNGPPVFEEVPKTTIQSTVKDDKRVLLAYSGGNDSTAVALKLKQQGYEPILFHVSRINNSYPNELGIVLKAAQKMETEVMLSQAHLRTKSDFKEQPTKDQLIMAMMVDYGMSIGVNQYATGNEEENFAKDCNVLYNWSDSLEMHRAASKWFYYAFPTYQLRYEIKSRGDSIRTLVDAGENWLDYTMCCMLPYRYQASRKKANEAKFGIKLGTNRCGSCYKCCAEYLCLIGQGADVVRSPEFARHCFKFFKERLDIIYSPGYGKDLTDEELLKVALDPRFTDIVAVAELMSK